jgi:peptide deformylase
MAVLEVLTYPNPELKKVSQLVSNFDSELQNFIADLSETLYASPGCVGIAAPQTGALRRLIIIDASRNQKCTSNHGRQVLINPEITSQEGSVMGREGCLSLPDFTANVVRANSIEVAAMNEKGEKVVLKTEGFEARVILHEVDHLDGILFLDRVTSLKTDVFRRKRVPEKLPLPDDAAT